MRTPETAGLFAAGKGAPEGLHRSCGQEDGVDPWLLLAQARGGKPESARQLVDALAPLAYRIAYRVMANKEDAQDVVQEAFLSLWRSPPSSDRGAQLSTWFTGITLNACRSRLRQRRLLEFWPGEEVLAASDLAAAAGPGDADAFEPAAITAATAQERLDAAMRALTPKQRLAVGMWAYGDASAAEIAQALDINANAAHQLLFKAKQSLRRHLDRRPA